MLLSNLDISSNKKKNKNRFVQVFYIVFLVLLLFSAYWLISHYQRIRFLIISDRYSSLQAELDTYRKMINETTPENQLQPGDVSRFLEIINDLIVANPDDGALHLIKANIYYLLVKAQIKQNPAIFDDTFFFNFISKHQIHPDLNKDAWENGIVSFRKALSLNLPEETRSLIISQLSEMYLLGGSPYWNSVKNDFYQSIQNPEVLTYYDILFHKSVIDWTTLESTHDLPSVEQIKAIYYLSKKNTPMAFTTLKDLTTIDNIHIKNNAFYLLSHLMRTLKNSKSELYYMGQIDLENFLPVNPWFLNHYYYLLRFYGQEAKAKQLLLQFESKINNSKPGEEKEDNNGD